MKTIAGWRSRVRRRWLFLGTALLVVGLGAGVFAALAWSGADTPLTRIFQRDQTWEQMQRRRTWRVGLDPSFPPFEYLDAGGTPVGLDVALAQQLAAAWGMRVEIVPIGFDSLPDALRAAKIDSIVSAYPYDARLTRDFGFSQPYFDAGLQLVVREGSGSEAEIELAGKRIAVEWGSTGDLVGRRWQREGKAVELVRFETPAETLDALQGRVDIDAALVDNVTLRQARAQGAALQPVGPIVESSPYVIAAPVRATDLQRQIQQTLATFAEDGTLAALESTWFGTR